MTSLFRHLRLAFRALRPAPAFTLAPGATLALGVGAGTAIFSAVSGVPLNALDYPALRQGMAPVFGGMVLGLLGALVGGRVLQSLLFGVPAGDPGTPAAAAWLLLPVAPAALYLPARRAARSDPMVALRND